jgi:hypothetical protein
MGVPRRSLCVSSLLLDRAHSPHAHDTDRHAITSHTRTHTHTHTRTHTAASHNPSQVRPVPHGRVPGRHQRHRGRARLHRVRWRWRRGVSRATTRSPDVHAAQPVAQHATCATPPHTYLVSHVTAASHMTTRYDMEDACILNKSSVERGFAHGRLIKTEMIDLSKERGNKQVFDAEPQPVSCWARSCESGVGVAWTWGRPARQCVRVLVACACAAALRVSRHTDGNAHGLRARAHTHTHTYVHTHTHVRTHAPHHHAAARGGGGGVPAGPQGRLWPGIPPDAPQPALAARAQRSQCCRARGAGGQAQGRGAHRRRRPAAAGCAARRCARLCPCPCLRLVTTSAACCRACPPPRPGRVVVVATVAREARCTCWSCRCAAVRAPLGPHGGCARVCACVCVCVHVSRLPRTAARRQVL